MAPLCVRFTTHSTGTILGSLVFMNQEADCLPSGSHILLVFDSWVLEHHLPSVFLEFPIGSGINLIAGPHFWSVVLEIYTYSVSFQLHC